jgi:hypothetical protein
MAGLKTQTSNRSNTISLWLLSPNKIRIRDECPDQRRKFAPCRPTQWHTSHMTNPDEAKASSAEDATTEGDDILEEASGGDFWNDFALFIQYGRLPGS